MKKIISIIGRSNSGKTTLIGKLIKEYKKNGLTVAILKSTSANISICDEKKDTEKFREAGAVADMISDGSKMVLHSYIDNNSPEKLIAEHFSHVDVVIVEGYKQEEFANIRLEVIGDNSSPLYETDIKGIEAIITDKEINVDLPVFKRDDVLGIMEFIEKTLT